MRFVGIEESKNSFLLAQVRKRKGQFEIEKLETWSTSEPDVKRLYKKFFKRKPITTGLCQVLFKSLFLPVTSKREKEKALSFQIESLLFLKPDSYLYEPVFSEKTEEVDLFITTKEVLQKHLLHWEKQGLDPEKVSFYSLALVRYTKSLFPSFSEGYIFHLGRDSITLVWMKKNLPFQSLFLEWGEEKMQEALKQGKQEEIKQEINRSFQSLKAEKKLPLFLTGNTKIVKNWLFEVISEYVENFLETEGKNRQTLQYAIAIGLAMNSLSKDSYAIQFRKNAWISSSFLKTLGLSVFLLFTFLIGSVLFLSYQKQKDLRYKRASLESVFEKAIEAEKSWFTKPGKEVPLEDKIALWEKAINTDLPYKNLASFPPTVSSFLHWLSHHPLLQSHETEIDKIEYSLLEYPSLEKRKAPYQTFVKVTLKIASPSVWRSFFETLSSEKSLVDRKKDFTWKQEGNVYEVAFFLKGGSH